MLPILIHKQYTSPLYTMAPCVCMPFSDMPMIPATETSLTKNRVLLKPYPDVVLRIESVMGSSVVCNNFYIDDAVVRSMLRPVLQPRPCAETWVDDTV